jgi:2TM domain-containing protein
MTTPTEKDLRARAEVRVKAREDFRIHLLVYVLVNALLWVIWFLSGADTRSLWPIYPLLGWGIGLGVHWYTVYGTNDQRRESEIEAEMRRLRGDDRR